MAEKKPESERIEYLDSVRGLAALCVFFSHFFGTYGAPPFLPEWVWFPPITLLGDGYAAVSVFFVLSGLVLILNYFYPKQKSFDLKKDLAPYVASRVIRICVPFGVMVLLTFFVYKNFYPVEHAELMEPSDWALSMVPPDHSFREAARQLLLPFPSEKGHFLPQDWTLTLELYASMLVPFILVIMGYSVWAAGFLVALLLGTNWYLLHFFLGMLTAKYFRFFQKGSKIALGYRILFALLLIPIASNETLVKVFTTGNLAWMINGFGAWGLLLLVISSRHAQGFLNLRPLVFLGRISYSTYLVHFLVLLMITPRILSALENSGLKDVRWAYAIAILGSLGFVVLSSFLFYQAVEKPTILFSRHFKKIVASWMAKITARFLA